MSIEKHEIAVSTTGSAGSAAGSTVRALPQSTLVAIYFDFHASAPSTTDTIVSAPGNPAALTILTLTNVNTDGWYYPRVQDHDNAGAAVTGSYSEPPIHGGNLDITLAQADALTNAVVATVLIRR